MNLHPSFALAISAAFCAALVGCASTEPVQPTVVRTPPPRNYEKTVTDYLAIKIRSPQKNAELSVGAPEPADCTLDISATSSRGWVVPVAYYTRTGEATGRETIRINTKQYYFWFLGNTIAGVTPRLELCPGVGTTFEAPPNPAAAGVPSALPVSASTEAQGDATKRAGTGDAKPSGAKKSTSSAKKNSSSSQAPAPAKKKTAPSEGKTPSS